MAKDTLPTMADNAMPAHAYGSTLTGGDQPSEAPHDYDPLIGILAAFEAIPVQHRDALFADFRKAAEAKDLRRLLDAISDWAATAKRHANPGLAAEVTAARGDRREVADWLRG